MKPFRLKSKQRDSLAFYGYISPWIVGFTLFTLLPMGLSLYYSFTKVTVLRLARAPKFVGLANYIRIFTKDTDFLASVGHTFYYSFFRVMIGVAISLLIAVLFNREMKFKRLFRTLTYLPAVLPIVGSALLWQLLFSNDLSLFNYIFSLVGFPKVQWLDYNNAMNSIILMSVWCGIGPTMTVLLASLQGVPQELLEAVEIDGGNAFHKFCYITLPMISPTLLYVIITGFIGTLQSYAEMKLLTGGGPGNATTTMSMLVVNNAFTDDGLGMGYASAEAWVIFIITLIFTVLFLRTSRKLVYYGGGENG